MDDESYSREPTVLLYTAAGKLFLEFADFENALSSDLRVHLGENVGDSHDFRTLAMAASIYGSMRFKTSKDTINRLVESEGLDSARKAALAKVFEHVGHIENLRNKLAHQRTEPLHDEPNGEWLISDIFTTRKLSDVTCWTIQTADIFDAATDLGAVCSWLGDYEFAPQLYSTVSATPPAWVYKPSALKTLPFSKLSALRRWRGRMPS